MECSAKIFYHNDFLMHDPSPYPHPERPERLTIAMRSLKESCKSINIMEPAEEDVEIFKRVHEESYYRKVLDVASSRQVEFLDPDTYVSPGTLQALRRLSGSVVEGVELVREGRGPVLVLGRPPGHHAGKRGTALGAPTLGFCIFNASALSAVLLSQFGKVVVVDFDAHHGNGTQDILWDLDIVHIDIHQDSATIYPGTGFPWQTGGVPGTKINVNVPPGSGDDIFIDTVKTIVEYLIEDIDPDYIVVSAGFDGYKKDSPFTSLNYSEKSFNYIGLALRDRFENVIVVTEGGYNLGLKRGYPAFLNGLFHQEVGGESTISHENIWRRYEKRKEELRKNLGITF